MNKSDLVKMAARRTSVTIPVAEDVISAFIDLLVCTLATEQDVSIRGFGKFQLRTRPPVQLKSPTSGDPILVGERRTTVFLPSVSLKERLNGDPT